MILMFFTASLKANDCRYWVSQVDPKIKDVEYEIDESDPQNIMNGIECFLKQKGNKKDGVFGGSKDYISQIVPKTTIEVNSLYRISELFYANDDFANAVALIQTKSGKLKFNQPKTVKKAYTAYQKWFKKVKKIGLEEARKQKLDPLDDSGVSWY